MEDEKQFGIRNLSPTQLVLSVTVGLLMVANGIVLVYTYATAPSTPILLLLIIGGVQLILMIVLLILLSRTVSQEFMRAYHTFPQIILLKLKNGSELRY